MDTSNSTRVLRARRTALRHAVRVPLLLLLVALLVGCGGGNGGGGGSNPPPTTDTTPPTPPSGLTASAVSATTVRLAWQASSDADSGVAGYRIYRDGAASPLASVKDTSYDDTGVVAGTRYSYTVRAYDAAEPANLSQASATVTVTTPTAGPPAAEVVLTTARVFAGLAPFDMPVLALQAPGDATNWYVVEQTGRVLAFANRADVATTRTFVDLRARIETGGEKGLLGMAFHPDYPANPRVYLSYTAVVDGGLVSRVAEFRTTDGGATLDAGTERVLLTVKQPSATHKGGHIAFGPEDGFLYFGLGDGGGIGDPSEPFGNGQDLQTLLGKIVRIDVDGTSDVAPYRVPPGNPYAGNAPCIGGSGAQACPEIYAYGFRNPWRWSFDRATGELWVADVGQDAREEIDRVTVGGNYGWRCYEGTLEFNPDCGPNAGVSLPPVVEYPHDVGRCVTGGYVYRGNAIGTLRGRYVFGDFISTRLWHVAHTVTPTHTVNAAEGVETGLGIVSFAEDAAGELYVLDYAGTMHRVIEAPAD